MSSYNGGQQGGNPTQRNGPPMYQGGGYGQSGSGSYQGGAGGLQQANWQNGMGGAPVGGSSPGTGVGMTQYPAQGAPGMNNIMSFDDTLRYQQGGQYGGTGAAYDPRYRPNGEMRQSFADPSGYAAMRAGQQTQLDALNAMNHRSGGVALPGGQRPGFGPPVMNPPPMTGGGNPPGFPTHGDPRLATGLFNPMPLSRNGY